MSDPRLIPVHLHKSRVAWAQVDAIDYERMAPHYWRLDYHGYVRHSTGRRGAYVVLHREIMGFVAGDGNVVDHVNGDKLDNRRSNLRRCTHAENAQNRRKRPGTSSRYQGVTWHKRCQQWQASVRIAGRSHYLGLFMDEDAAGAVVAAFRAEHMPFSTEAREAA